jgi:hypothetical protein
MEKQQERVRLRSGGGAGGSRRLQWCGQSKAGTRIPAGREHPGKSEHPGERRHPGESRHPGRERASRLRVCRSWMPGACVSGAARVS